MPPSRIIRFGPLDTDLYEVWEPSPGTAAGITVPLVHGGLWLADYDRGYLRPLANALAREGLHVALIEYARVGMPGGGWPGTGESVLAAMAAASADADLPDIHVSVGHSSGGHLVGWAASEDRAPWLRGAVTMAAVLDLHSADAADPVASAAIRQLLGGGPNEAVGAWADADPMRQRLTVPTVVMHGRQDPDVPVQLAMLYVRSRTAQEPACRLEIVDDCDHFGLVNPGHPAFETLVSAIRQLAAAEP